MEKIGIKEDRRCQKKTSKDYKIIKTSNKFHLKTLNSYEGQTDKRKLHTSNDQ